MAAASEEITSSLVRPLMSKTEHRLGPFWRSEEILDAIDAFAARAGRRERAR